MKNEWNQRHSTENGGKWRAASGTFRVVDPGDGVFSLVLPFAIQFMRWTTCAMLVRPSTATHPLDKDYFMIIVECETF